MTTTDLIYLACPYTHELPAVRQERFELANEYAARLMKSGLKIFSPISHTHPIALRGLPPDWDFWEAYDRIYLGLCRAIVVLAADGWETSKGVRSEILIMSELRRPVYWLVPDDEKSFASVVVALYV